ncbi:MAG: hypothetical protein FWF18_01800 [Dehalococcoidia bacterium]|nr:hypothetical protein [Dehalococcoidia bacterium]
MALSWNEIQSKAIAFSKRWEAAHKEEAQAQSFTTDFLRVFGVSDPEAIGDFEYKVPLSDGKMGYIDYVWKQPPPPAGGTPFEKGAGETSPLSAVAGIKGVSRSDGGLFICGSDGAKIPAKNINPYLLEAPTVFIESRSKPICDVPNMSLGNQPIDGGHYLFTAEEKEEFLKKEPQAEKWFRPWIGSHEFINRYYRYFLFLKNCSPAELRTMPEAMKRVEAVKMFRLESNREVTKQLAETPREFAFTNISDGTFIVVPEVSSERRRYIPIGFLTPEILCSNLVKIIPNATLYHFGILTSSVHMAWTRAVCGRLKSDYRYSNTLVYNNFPWPEAPDKEKATIEKLAQAVLGARAVFSDSSLADLYDPLTMPSELLKVHQKLDRAVMKLYGFDPKTTELEIVAELLGRYKELADNDIK